MVSIAKNKELNKKLDKNKKLDSKSKNEIEIMAPVGSMESLASAIKAKANSIYFGIEELNMRARAAKPFTIEDLEKISKICIKNKIKSYLTLNTVMYDGDIEKIKKICDASKKAKISAIIASDISVINYANEIGIAVHASTQLNISNIEAVKFYSKFVDVMVLARELNIEQIKQISEEIKKQNIKGPGGKLIKIELFIHGALCVAISGKCYMSLAQYNTSANRGDCLQACRRKYKVIDLETNDELEVENKYIMSPKDLCTIKVIDKIIESGATVFKIEGRGRPPEYVYKTVTAYKEAIDAYYNNTLSKEKIDAWEKNLAETFNRGFWHGGYYLGNKLGEWCDVYGSKATQQKIFIGISQNYFVKTGIAEFILQSGELNKGDKILITGETTGVIDMIADEIMIDKVFVDKAVKGDVITIPLKERVRKKDKLYVIVDK